MTENQCIITMVMIFIQIEGSSNGKIYVWSADSGKRISVIDGMHPGSTHCVTFNPKYMMFASSCSNLVSILFNFSFFEKRSDPSCLMICTLGVQTFARSKNREIYDIYFREFNEKIIFANIHFRDFGVSKFFASLNFRE